MGETPLAQVFLVSKGQRLRIVTKEGLVMRGDKARLGGQGGDGGACSLLVDMDVEVMEVLVCLLGDMVVRS
ncbi:hypothetical protein Tco_0839831 [Tanacetum coccineum]|uniref:Uncharacterized protein n=1 Tax=Tanacetum coccineum TaxID=301880 RepID=A0ABQ5AW91_9ASTR